MTTSSRSPKETSTWDKSWPSCSEVTGTPAVQSAPRLTREAVERLALELYGIDCSAEPLPSERDQNFLLRDSSGAQFVLKIANSQEDPAILDLQNRALEHL